MFNEFVHVCGVIALCVVVNLLTGFVLQFFSMEDVEEKPTRTIRVVGIVRCSDCQRDIETREKVMEEKKK